ncbi:MAG: asparagine synthase (glutamine-hydrolyzing) [Bacteroidota bacterium]
MCGICGKVHFDPSHNIDPVQLERMSDTLYYRGPDDSGQYISGNVGLGFRRLSIIDLEGGHQPLANEDETIWIAFNGEVYNFQEIKKVLEAKGHVFRTNTDSEVVVHAYEEYGEACVDHLRGMFAFAIWDENKQQLFCVRDRFGIKPFFYYMDHDKFIFGSEIKAIMASGEIRNELDIHGLDSYLAFQYIAGERTIYEAIKKLKPAHTLTIRPRDSHNRITIKRYWETKYEPDFSKTEEDWIEELDEVLTESVKLRLISDVPLGAFLSGGIDSSSVVGLMSKLSSSPVKTFSIGFKEKKFNELPYAREVAARYNTEHHEQIIEPESVELLPLLVRAYDEPFADSSAIPTYYVSKFAREYVTVVLSGDGGDELFAGYNHYPKWAKIHKYNVTPAGFNKLVWGSIHKMIPTKVKGKGITYLLSQDRNYFGSSAKTWNIPERAALYKRELWKKLADAPAEKYRENIIRSVDSKDFIWRMQQADMHSYMTDDVLTKVDRVSMRVSLEARVPILDHKVAELSFKIPTSFKLRGDDKKYILKKAMAKYLPESVVSHRKQGFSVPLKQWFKDDLKAYVHDKLVNPNPLLSEFINQDYVAKIVEDHNSGMRDLNNKIWSLIFLNAWLEEQKDSIQTSTNQYKEKIAQ